MEGANQTGDEDEYSCSSEYEHGDEMYSSEEDEDCDGEEEVEEEEEEDEEKVVIQRELEWDDTTLEVNERMKRQQIEKKNLSNKMTSSLSSKFV